MGKTTPKELASAFDTILGFAKGRDVFSVAETLEFTMLKSACVSLLKFEQKLGDEDNAIVIPPEDLEKHRSTGAACHAHILRGLISYHERMTMGMYPERDAYLEALRFALECVEEKIEIPNG